MVAHSMGGLLARRYILNYLSNHSVRKLVTIGSPFLGSPKSLMVMETGGFLETGPDILTAIRGGTSGSANRVFKQLLPYMYGAHELFPSQSYFSLGGIPFAERFDFNGNGLIESNGYNYDMTQQTFNARFTTRPYENNHLFHQGQQDDWRLDTSGVEYYHLHGRQTRSKTPIQIVAKRRIRGPRITSNSRVRFETVDGIGDGTVPRLSARRNENGTSLNATGSVVREIVPQETQRDSNVEHNGLTANSSVHGRLFEILGLRTQPVVGSPSHQGKGTLMESENVVEREANYLVIEGVETLRITDNLGNTNTPVNEFFELNIPDVSYSSSYNDGTPSGSYTHDLVMPDDRIYTVKFRTTSDIVDIELVRGIGNSEPNHLVRYVDLELPANVECLLTVNGQDLEDLRYDSNGDGTYDVVVPAHVRVSGAAAQDITAPEVTFAKDMATGLVSVNAADSESGVGTIYYRYAGDASFQIYTAPFVPTANSLEAFADDNVGNRSSPVTASLVSISGQVKDSFGRAVSSAKVTLTDPQGGSSIFYTNSFGYYRFDSVLTGQSYVLAVTSRRYTFEPRTVMLTGELTGFDFIANP